MKNYGELAVPAPVWQHGEVAKLRAELATSKQALEFTMLELQQLTKNLSPLCPCSTDPSYIDGPQQECPIHGDGDTFVAEVQQLRGDLALYEAWAARSPAYVHECGCGTRFSVRVAADAEMDRLRAALRGCDVRSDDQLVEDLRDAGTAEERVQVLADLDPGRDR